MSAANAGFPDPGVVNLPIYRGDRVYAPFRLYSTVDDGVTKDYYDLSGFTIVAQVREHADADEVLLELDVEIVDPQSDEDVKGSFIVSAPSEATEGLPILVGVWDVELTDGDGERRTWIEGAVPIRSDKSRLVVS